jgi:hypothetical protein
MNEFDSLLILISAGIVSFVVNILAIKSVRCQKRVSRINFVKWNISFFTGLVLLFILISFGIDIRVIGIVGAFHVVFTGGLLSKRLLGRLNDAGIRYTVAFAYFAAIPVLGVPILIYLSIKQPSFPNLKINNI